MKRFILFIVVLSYISGYGQVGINTDNSDPDGSAILDLKSTDKGLLIPRLTSIQLYEIQNPAISLMVFNLDSNDIYIFDGTYWLGMRDNTDTINPSVWICMYPFTINHIATGGVAPVNKTVTYGTITNIPGELTKCWITSNLGADHQADSVDDATEASAGWYWQFNRKQGYKHDGETRTPNTTWITPIIENLDWQAANDPCTLELGSGWRIPTLTEWTNVNASGGWTNWNDPWNSGLKMHAAGLLVVSNGGLGNHGVAGCYWSSMQYDTGKGWYMYFYITFSSPNEDPKAGGYTMRCLRD